MSVVHTIKFKDWFWGKFEEWRKGSINGPTAFAAYLGIKQQYVSRWLDGYSPPKSLTIIKKIAEKYPDVYEVLGVEPEPDPYHQIPQPYRDNLKAALNEITNQLTQKQIPPESDEGQKIAREIFDKYGFDVSAISIRDDDSPRGTNK